MKKFRAGFSLVEILVVVALIGILSSVLYINVSEGTAQSRDAQRQADLRMMEVAVELYKNKYGRYPEGCNGPGVWSGHSGSYQCASGNEYIIGVAPEFIPRLPQDPKLNGVNSGYVYATDPTGSTFIIKARLTVETETVGYDHAFKSCDSDGGASDGPICNALSVRNNSGNPPVWCQSGNPTFDSSYGIWGGILEEQYGWTHRRRVSGVWVGHSRAQENTETIRCMIH